MFTRIIATPTELRSDTPSASHNSVIVYTCCSHNYEAPVYSQFIPSHIGRVLVWLGVTSHLHFWQNDRDFLRAAVVTRGWTGYRIGVSAVYWPRRRNYPASPAGNIVFPLLFFYLVPLLFAFGIFADNGPIYWRFPPRIFSSISPLREWLFFSAWLLLTKTPHIMFLCLPVRLCFCVFLPVSAWLWQSGTVLKTTCTSRTHVPNSGSPELGTSISSCSWRTL